MTHKEKTVGQTTLVRMARRNGVAPDGLMELSGGWLNHNYRFKRRGAKCVLRVSPAAVRPSQLVKPKRTGSATWLTSECSDYLLSASNSPLNIE